MSLLVPLQVAITTARGTSRVTRQVRDLQFRTVVPGGYASATFDLDRSLALQPKDIDYFAPVVISDGRTGRVIWEGRIEDPGRSAGGQGEVWRVAAVGPSAHARDLVTPLHYVDQQLSGWQRDSLNTPRAARVDAAGDAIDFNFTQGTVLAINFTARASYTRSTPNGLGRVSMTWVAGNTDGSHRIAIRTRAGVGSPTDAYAAGWTNTPQAVAASRNGANDIPSGDDTVQIIYTRANSQVTVTDDTGWQQIQAVCVRSRLHNADGTIINTAGTYNGDTVLASQVVADLLGSVLPRFDGAGAAIATTSYAITQLAYPDGVSAWDVLDDLMELEPAYFWAAWERNSAGLHRFEWSAWPTTIRYEATADDGFDSPGSAAELYSAVRVRYRTSTGGIATVRRTQTVPALVAAGVDREAYVDLGDDAGSTAAQANQAGDMFLSEHAAPPNAGRLTIARPILDRVTGRLVRPWEILPGNLIRVRGVLPRLDALNASARDGVTVFKVASVDFVASRAAAVLELDTYSRSTAAALAAIARTKPGKRRR